MLRPVIDAARFLSAAAKRFVGDVFFEKPAGIETAQVVRLHELGLAAKNRVDYMPSPWLALGRVLSDKEVSENDVFIDFGCGKGRVVFQAAMYPFRRVVGVELSAELLAVAKRNIERALPKLRCKNIELVAKDVLDYDIPDDLTVAYFYNPFDGEVFSTVVGKLLASLRRNPRRLTIVYMNPVEEHVLLEAGAKLVKATRGWRPTPQWALQNSVRKYTLEPAP